MSNPDTPNSLLPRQIRGGDAEAVLTLRHNVYSTDPDTFSEPPDPVNADSINSLSRILGSLYDSSAHLVLGVFDQRLLGMVGISLSSELSAQLWGFYVLQACRRQGIGSKLLNEAICFCDEIKGVSEISLEATENAVSAIRLYESNGFLVQGRDDSPNVAEHETVLTYRLTFDR